jgi:hypothetical protein
MAAYTWKTKAEAEAEVVGLELKKEYNPSILPNHASMVNPFNDAKTDFEKISNIGTIGDLEVHSIVENIRTSNYVWNILKR